MARIHSSAVIDKSSQLAEDVVIGPNSVVEKAVCIGAGTVLGANVVVHEENLRAGDSPAIRLAVRH